MTKLTSKNKFHRNPVVRWSVICMRAPTWPAAGPGSLCIQRR